MKTKITVLIAFLVCLSNHDYAQVTPGSVVEENIDNYLSTPANNYSVLIPVVIIRYLPTLDGVNVDIKQATDYWSLGYITIDSLISNIDTYDKRVKFALEEASKFHGYKDPNAAPYLGYKVIKYLTVYRQMYPGLFIENVGTKKVYQTDYLKEFSQLNLTNFINDNNVKEVWVWAGDAATPSWPSYDPAIHGDIPYYVLQAESNMSSPTTGDISNSYRYPTDLPIVNHTYVVYGQNFRRTQAEAMHNHGHQLECLYKFANAKLIGNTDLFLRDFCGWPNGNYTVPPIGRAGDCHHPPNTYAEYDYLNPTLVESDIEDWKPAGGVKKLVNLDTWSSLVFNWPGAPTFQQRRETQWYIYWMQNMPGANSFIPYNSNIMTNWWKFTADWDYSMKNNIGLFEPLTQLPESAGGIVGHTTICQGQDSIVYSVPSIAYTASYIWTLPPGATGASSTNSITVNYGLTSVSGNISVKGNNPLGEGVPSSLAIKVNSLPSDPNITLIGAKLHSSASSGNQWYNQDGIIPGATDQDYTIIADGSYYVIFTIDGCSSNPSNTIYISLTGLSSPETEQAIRVYPNPAKDQITIQFKGNRKITGFEIINSLNQVVYKGVFDEKILLNTSSLSCGIYLIKLENGKFVKFMK